MSNDKKILLIAGETSGDAHGAKLIQALRQKSADIQFVGMGGNQMHQAGMKQIVDSNGMAVVGFFEIFKIISKILHAFKVIKEHIKTQKPDLVILIDYPGFNLRIAKFAKQHGCKVLYYISPQLWAWRPSRVKIIQQCVDEMAVVLPFEVDFYNHHNVKAHYVGHPLLSDIPKLPTVEQARYRYMLKPEQLVIGLCPGSRASELKHLLPVMLKTAKLLRQKYPNCQFAIPLSPNLPDSLYESIDEKYMTVRGDFYDLMTACDVVICASGTATLQIAMTKTPMLIVYKSSWLSVTIARFLVKTPLIGLCNLIAGKKIVQEYIQSDVTPEKCFTEVSRMIEDRQYHDKIAGELATVTDHLSEDIAQQKVEDLAYQLIS